ncbi:MAG: hypothetical protein RI637_04690 [Acidimicrobiia bacterium]|nr:hypothetical protein [Acidimicrobiia bacterium]
MSNTDLSASLAAAFPRHVERRLQELGLSRPDTLDDALAEGVAWLRETLDDLLAAPFAEQRRGPLEVFQEAMRFPTDALAAAGIGAVARDPAAMAALPGDLYDLAPASSRELGDEVWMAHLVWGAAKARALGRSRRVGLRSVNLMDRSRIEPLVVGSGSEFVVWDDISTAFAGGRRPDLVLVDLTLSGSLEAVEQLTARGVRVIAFGPHVDRSSLLRAQQAGADEALARSTFFAKLGDLLS